MSRPEKRSLRPVVGARLRPLLKLVFLLFGLLVVNSVYLAAVTLLEQLTGAVHQNYLYLVMFLVHLLLGLLLVVPLIVFAALHMRNAWRRPNRYAFRVGISLFVSALLLLLSGILLTRFGFFEVNHPGVRSAAYWVHLLSPLVVIWLFVLHRLAGARIRWRVGANWAVATGIFAVSMLGLHLLQSTPPRVLDEPYAPAQVSLQAESPVIPAEHLMQDAVCAECHGDIAEQTAQGMHRLSSFNNPAYRFSVQEAREVLLERDGEVRVARLCAVCHDQVPLFSGAFDDPDYDLEQGIGSHAGITCIGCHGITAVHSPIGNGAYSFRDPPRYPFAHSDSAFLKAVNHQLIKAKPAFHQKTFLKPVHKSALFCSSCHKVHLPYALNHYRWLRGQNHYDSFRLSGVSGHRVDSFYYPPRAAANCAQCHMPPTPSDDPAARNFAGSGQRSVHNHLFAAANTGVPHLLQQGDQANETRRSMMRRAARVDIFAVREGGEIDGRLLGPLRPELPVLQPGRSYLLETVVRTVGVGHQLTQGTVDSNELWLDVTLSVGGRVIGRSGSLDAEGDVDPWAYFANAYLLDRNGERIERRNAQDVFVALYDHQIPPGAAAVVHYAFEAPPAGNGPLVIDVKLKYRKFDTRFLRHVQGESFRYNDLPITVMAADRLELALDGGESAPSQTTKIPVWERWNDYGIGLLRQGGRGSAKGALRQAEAAFSRVEALVPAQGALNLTRVYFKEGRLEEAADALRRASVARPAAPPWTLAWYSALVDREYGNLDRAIASLESIVDTRFNEARDRGFDFSQDNRVLTELGRTLYERARLERGASRSQARLDLLQQARSRLELALKLDPEDVKAHYNLALVAAGLGDEQAAERHRASHQRYRRDDNAVEQAVTRHRRLNPAADHAAQPIAVYDLQRPGVADDERGLSALLSSE